MGGLGFGLCCCEQPCFPDGTCDKWTPPHQSSDVNDDIWDVHNPVGQNSAEIRLFENALVRAHHFLHLAQSLRFRFRPAAPPDPVYTGQNNVDPILSEYRASFPLPSFVFSYQGADFEDWTFQQEPEQDVNGWTWPGYVLRGGPRNFPGIFSIAEFSSEDQIEIVVTHNQCPEFLNGKLRTVEIRMELTINGSVVDSQTKVTNTNLNGCPFIVAGIANNSVPGIVNPYWVVSNNGETRVRHDRFKDPPSVSGLEYEFTRWSNPTVTTVLTAANSKFTVAGSTIQYRNPTGDDLFSDDSPFHKKMVKGHIENLDPNSWYELLFEVTAADSSSFRINITDCDTKADIEGTEPTNSTGGTFPFTRFIFQPQNETYDFWLNLTTPIDGGAIAKLIDFELKHALRVYSPSDC
jgi:hypothetical protein